MASSAAAGTRAGLTASGTIGQAGNALARLRANPPISGEPVYAVSGADPTRAIVQMRGIARRDLTREYVGSLLSGTGVRFTIAGETPAPDRSGGILDTLAGLAGAAAGAAADPSSIPQQGSDLASQAAGLGAGSSFRGLGSKAVNAAIAPIRAARNALSEIKDSITGAIDSTPTRIAASIAILMIVIGLVAGGAFLAFYLLRGG